MPYSSLFLLGRGIACKLLLEGIALQGGIAAIASPIAGEWARGVYKISAAEGFKLYLRAENLYRIHS